MKNVRSFLSIVFVVAGLVAFGALAYWLWVGEQESKLPYSTGYDPLNPPKPRPPLKQ
jgi:hypothetical protein